MSPPKAILWVRGGPNDGETVGLADEITLIGRSEDNNIVVEEGNVSRQHAGIRSEATGYWIEDLGSRNGTFVNGAQVEGEGQRLRDNDKIELGGAEDIHWVFKELGATVTIERPQLG